MLREPSYQKYTSSSKRKFPMERIEDAPVDTERVKGRTDAAAAT